RVARRLETRDLFQLRSGRGPRSSERISQDSQLGAPFHRRYSLTWSRLSFAGTGSRDRRPRPSVRWSRGQRARGRRTGRFGSAQGRSRRRRAVVELEATYHLDSHPGEMAARRGNREHVGPRGGLVREAAAGGGHEPDIVEAPQWRVAHVVDGRFLARL